MTPCESAARHRALRAWSEAVIYEIYVRSFLDSNGDGVGDLPGVRARLPYIAGLGVDAIWLTPIHPSPDADLGYDVTDYEAVDPRLGTLADVTGLIEAAHARGIAVLLDWVGGHTSDQHRWFKESRASPAAARRGWYLWRRAANNWRSMAGGSAWQHDPLTDRFYLHTFLREQPDLNWREPAVRRAMADAMRFWLDRGIDGFRLDALPLWIKDARFRDNPPNPRWRPGDGDYRRLHPEYTADQPEMSEVIAFLRSVLDGYDGRLLVAEMGLPPARAARYHAAIDIPFNFGLITQPWTAAQLHRRIAAHLEALPAGAWPNWVLGNHDVPRLATRLGAERARVAAVLATTLPGTLTLYAGDELGLPDNPRRPAKPRDGFGRLDPARSRDAQRAPMPWNGSTYGGFSATEPWLPTYPTAATVSVAAQDQDPASTLSLYRRLLELRRERHWALGRVSRLETDDGLLRYERVVDERTYQVLAQIADADHRLPLPDGARPLLSSRHPTAIGDHARELVLRGPEAVVLEL